MALNISAWSIRNPLPSLLLFTALTIVGALSFQNLPVTDMPEVQLPIVSVSVAQNGAAPAELETEVTIPVENALSGIVGVNKLTSQISEGQSETTVEFAQSVTIDRALDDVRDAISGIAGDLPGAASEPVIQRAEEGGGPIVTYVVDAPGLSPEAQSWLIDDRITRAIKTVPGVAKVTRDGGTEREIRVDLDPLRLQAHGLTAAEVSTQISQQLMDVSSGRSAIGRQEQSLRVYGDVGDLADLARLQVTTNSGQIIALGDLATIADGRAVLRSAAFLDGTPVIAFGVLMAKGYSSPTIAAKIAEVLAQLDEDLKDVSIRLIDSSVPEIEATYAATMDTLIEGAILAIIVVLLFLRDFRATVISAIAIPLSILPTFWVMSLLGFSLNNISLLAITLVTGVLVDDAIVEIENITRHMRMGKSPYRAAMEAADEIGLAIVATSATIVAVFLPVSFISGLVGQFFKQFGITIAVSVLFSLAVARLISPLLAAYFMKDLGHVETGPGPVLRLYARILDWCLRWRFATITGGVAIFVASIWVALQLASGLFPEEDGSRSQVNIELPPGATLYDAVERVLQASDLLQAQPEVQSVYASVGTGGDPRLGGVAVTLVPPAQRAIDQRGFERLMQAELSALPDMKVSFSAGMGGRDFEISLAGADGPEVSRMAVVIESAIVENVPSLQNVQSGASLVRPELRIVPRASDAAALGISPTEISNVLQIATQGDLARNLPKFSDNGRLIDIRVRLPETAARDMAMLETLLLRSSSGYIVALASVADIGMGVGPTAIERQDRERKVQIVADLAPGADLGSALAAVMDLDEVTSLPKGITFGSAGDAELMGEVFGSFFLAMGAGLMLVLIVLILLYSDIFQPITILLSLPLSIGGAMGALMLTGHGISLPVVIGIMMLIGIVTKNAILLVDFAIEEIHRGKSRRTALIEAGLKRAQPIVMTTVAMSAGMLPAALGGSSGDGFRVPMAIAVIGGLVISTGLSLVFVPAAFSYLDDLKSILARIFGRFVTGRDETSVHQLRLPLQKWRPEAAE
ncbi:efflux RND transporter permease subunit [Arenibacterium sp. LLYu02]|uniref:efflux RND transporter permease subunit n=1 Tax=Arenibacterium sp. LLYu02 TaxID=3404132 RepID=UPI003B20BE84